MKSGTKTINYMRLYRLSLLTLSKIANRSTASRELMLKFRQFKHDTDFTCPCLWKCMIEGSDYEGQHSTVQKSVEHDTDTTRRHCTANIVLSYHYSGIPILPHLIKGFRLILCIFIFGRQNIAHLLNNNLTAES